MRLLTSVALVSVIFLSGFAAFVALKTVPQLNFASKGMDWQWHWAYFLPFSNGIQQTRTQDTKQLLLRRVYLEDDIAVFVSTTLDNKFEIDVFKAVKCNASSSEWASVSVNGAPMTHVPLKCEPSGDGYLFRHVANKLKPWSLALKMASLSKALHSGLLMKSKRINLNSNIRRFLKSRALRWSRG